MHDLTEAKVRDAVYKCINHGMDLGMDLATMSYKHVYEALNSELNVDILMWKDKSVLKEMIQEVRRFCIASVVLRVLHCVSVLNAVIEC